MEKTRAGSGDRPIDRSEEAQAGEVVSLPGEEITERYRQLISSILAPRFEQWIKNLSKRNCERLLNHPVQDIQFYNIVNDLDDRG